MQTLCLPPIHRSFRLLTILLTFWSVAWCGPLPKGWAQTKNADALAVQAVHEQVPVAHPPGKGIHWVLLVDTSSYASDPKYALAFEKAASLLWQAGRMAPGDWISVAPYQREMNAAYFEAHFRKPVVRYGDVYSTLPPQTQQPGNGHEPDRAVRDVLQRLKEKGRDKNGTVLLLLARDYLTQKPTGDPNAHIVEPDDPELTALLDEAKMQPASFPLTVSLPQGDTVIQVRHYIPQPLVGTERAPVPLPAWLLPLLILLGILLVAGIVLLWLRLMGIWPPPPHRPALEIGRPGGSPEMNRNFPPSKRIVLYGTGQKLEVGEGDKPSRVSLPHPDLPIAASGPLLEIDARDRNRVILKPNLCTASVKDMAYDEAKEVTLTPDPSAGGMAVTYRFKVTRKRNN